jgi:hypothetical protein
VRDSSGILFDDSETKNTTNSRRLFADTPCFENAQNDIIEIDI